MSLADLVRNAVALANTVTATLQGTVVYRPALRAEGSGYGDADLGDPVPVSALIDQSQKLVKTASGELVPCLAKLTFLTPMTVSLKDRFVLPDGTTGPILNTGGFVDAGTGQPYVTQVVLGY